LTPSERSTALRYGPDAAESGKLETAVAVGGAVTTGAASEAPATGGAAGRVRLILYWAAFLFLVALTAYGFWSHPALLATVWTPSGQVRFLGFSAVYFAAVGAIYLIAARRLPLILAVLMAVISCGAVGVGGPGAAALFFLSSLVLGRAVLFRGKVVGEAEPTDMLLAILLGSAIYMTVIGWTAMFPVHYAAVHIVALVLPLLLWPAVLRQCLAFLRDLLRPREWSGPWDYLGFALAGFVPLALLLNAVLLPQVNNDAVVMHLAVPSFVSNNHRWSFDVHRYIFAVMPMGASWTLLPSYLLGGEFAARIVNFCYLLITGFLVFLAIARFLTRGTAWMLTALYASTPFLLAEAGNIFVENIWVALLFGAALALVRFRETGREPYFLLAVALAAASLAVKVIGALLCLALAAFALGACLKRPVRLVWALGIVALMGAYPYLFAFIKTGNPVFPFMNQIFLSPYFAPAAFTGVNRSIPKTLYELTFLTQGFVDGGGTNGAFGFQYLVLVPLALLAIGLRYPYMGRLSLAAFLVFIPSVFLLAEANLRYIYPALPFVMVLIALAYAQMRSLSKSLYASVCVFGVVATLVNAYAMPLSAWAHRDFSLAMTLGRKGVDEYRDWAAPERRLIDYLNLTRGPAVRVVTFARPMLIDLQGQVIFGNWYDYLFSLQRAKATSAEAVHRLMREQRITKFISFKPGTGYSGLAPAVAAFLDEYTEPEFVAGDAYLARYKEEFRFSEEMLANGDFANGLEKWSSGDASMYDAAAGIVSVSSAKGLVQRIAVDDRVLYRYSITARCTTPDTHIRIWVNWFDAAQRHIHSNLTPRKCEDAFKTFSEDFTPRAGARFADVYVYGHEPDKSVLVSRVSFKW
jgi:hypothetical protein